MIQSISSSQMSSSILIHHMIEEWASHDPAAIAISYKGEELSYKTLNEKSNQLAHYLIKEGVKPESLVGVGIERSLEMIISVLGILKAGGAYVPIDASNPKERINYMLADSKLSLLITQHSLLEKLPQCSIKKICLDVEKEKINNSSKVNPKVQTDKNNLAYVLYTSGSTGNPKGVMVCHRSLLHVFSGWKKVYKLKNDDSHLQMANFSFDVFTGDLIRALCSGAKLVLCPKEILLEPEKLYQLMLTERVNCAEFVQNL